MAEEREQSAEIEPEAAPEPELEEEFEAASPEQAFKKLREKLKICQRERQEFLATSQRARADYINLKRETEAAQQEFAKFANEGLILEIIALADSFEQAFADKKSWERAPEDWRRGIEQIYQQLETLLRRHGVEKISPLGRAFDTKEHQAAAIIDTDKEEEDNIIKEVVRAGYRLHGRIIRPAAVKTGRYHK